MDRFDTEYEGQDLQSHFTSVDRGMINDRYLRTNRVRFFRILLCDSALEHGSRLQADAG